MHPPLPGKPRLCALAIQIPYKTPAASCPMSLVAWFQGQTANRMELLHNSILQKLSVSKIRNGGGNHEIIVVSTAKILGCFSKKAILQQPLPFFLLIAVINNSSHDIYAPFLGSALGKRQTGTNIPFAMSSLRIASFFASILRRLSSFVLFSYSLSFTFMSVPPSA